MVALCRYRHDESQREKDARGDFFTDPDLINTSIWSIYLPFICNLLRPLFHYNPKGMTDFTWAEIGNVFERWHDSCESLRAPMAMHHSDTSQPLHGALTANVVTLQRLTENYVHWKKLNLGLAQLSDVVSKFVDMCALRRTLEHTRRGVLMEMMQSDSNEDDRTTYSLAGRLADIERRLGPEAFNTVGTQIQAEEFTTAIGAARNKYIHVNTIL